MSFACFWKKRRSIRITCVTLLSALVLFMCLPLLCGSRGSMASNHCSAAVPVKFLYKDPRAHRVCVRGSFNEWSSQAHCMKRENDGWSITVFLAPGRYQYIFLIDGIVRQKDPDALLSQDNEFGEENSVLVVE